MSVNAMEEENGEPSGDQETSGVLNEVLNYPPCSNLLPPNKSKKRGRPREKSIKSKLDIAIRNMVRKEKKKNEKNNNEKKKK